MRRICLFCPQVLDPLSVYRAVHFVKGNYVLNKCTTLWRQMGLKSRLKWNSLGCWPLSFRPGRWPPPPPPPRPQPAAVRANGWRGGRRLRRMGHCSRIEHSPYPLKGRHARGRSWLVVRVDWQCRTTASGQGEEEYSTFVPLPSGATKCARARQTLFSQKGSCSLPFQLTNLSLCRLSGHLVSLSLFHFVSII